MLVRFVRLHVSCLFLVRLLGTPHPLWNATMRRQSEREKVDSRILEEELAALAIQHREKLASLEQELKEDEQKVSRSFERERVRGETKILHVVQGPLASTLLPSSRESWPGCSARDSSRKLPLVFTHRQALTAACLVSV